MVIQDKQTLDKSGSKKSAFAVAYACLLSFAFVFQSLPPIMNSILTDLKLDHAQAGLLMGFFALPGIVITIPGGWLADRYGTKRVGAISLILMIVGVIITAGAANFFQLALGRLTAGTGAMLLVVLAARLVSHTYSGAGLGVAMGFYNTGMPLGTIISFNVLGAFGEEFGWRAAALAPAFVCAAALVLLLTAGESADDNPRITLRESLVSVGSRIWLLGLAWLWFNAAAIAFLTFSPDYFAGLGYSGKAANFLASFLMWGALLISPAIGPFISTARRKESVMLAGSVLPALLYFTLTAAPNAVVPVVVFLGLTTALLPAPLFALPADVVDPDRLGLAFGVLSTCLNVGILLGPFLVGLSRDITQTYQVGFILMAGFSALAALSIVPLMRSRPHQPAIKPRA